MKFRILLCIFFEESINSHRRTRPKPVTWRLCHMVAWWQAAAARKHLRPARRQFRNPIKNDIGGYTRPKPVTWRLCHSGLGGRLQLHGGIWGLPAAGSKPDKKWVWRQYKAEAGLCHPSWGAWWQAAAARKHSRAARRQLRNRIKNDFGGHTRPKPVTWRLRHPSWGLAAGCSCTEAFEGCPAAVSKPDKKMSLAATPGRSRLLGGCPFWGLGGRLQLHGSIWGLPGGSFETR